MAETSEYTLTTDVVRGRIHARDGFGFWGLEEFNTWLVAHDAEVRASVVPEIGMQCADSEPHAAHAWQMSATGWCLCSGVVADEPDWEWTGEDKTTRRFTDNPDVAQKWIKHGLTVRRRTKQVPAGPWVPVKQGDE